MRWLVPGRVAAANDMGELDDSVHTALLLGRAARGPAYGRSASGHFVVDRPLHRAHCPALHELQTCVDFLRYEHAVGRVIAIIAKPAWLAQTCVECLAVAEGLTVPRTEGGARRYAQAVARDGESRLRSRGGQLRSVLRTTLTHTTSVEAMPSIVRDAALKSPALMGTGPGLGMIIFKEPEDYGEYVMFSQIGGFRGGISGEIVVNSRRIGEFWDPDRAAEGDYVPGVRLYFSRAQLESHPGVTFDGVHGLKVKGQVELAGYLTAVATADCGSAKLCELLGVPVLRPPATTPEQYVAESDRLFVQAMSAAPTASRGR